MLYVKSISILILCTGNSAGSILAEALFNHLGRGRVHAFSAGSQPLGRVDPLALQTLAAHGVPWPNAGQPRSKSWEEFLEPGAPAIDLVIAVCAEAADAVLPAWRGHPPSTRWVFDDLAAIAAPAERRAAFATIYEQLEKHVRAFLGLPFEAMPNKAIAEAAQALHIPT